MTDSALTDASNNEPDPYATGLVDRKLRIIKEPIEAKAVGILTNKGLSRNMQMVHSSSRAVRRNDVHELVCTDREYLPGETVSDVGYLAFICLEESGVLAVGDVVEVEGKALGKVLGFNEVHAPNHINVIIRLDSLSTGLDEGWTPGTRLIFRHSL